MHRSLSDELTQVDTNFADAPSNREAAGLGELAPVHEARSALETREEAVRLDAHDGICKFTQASHYIPAYLWLVIYMISMPWNILGS